MLRLQYDHEPHSVDLALISLFSADHNGLYQEARVPHMRITILLSCVVGGEPSSGVQERQSHPGLALHSLLVSFS